MELASPLRADFQADFVDRAARKLLAAGAARRDGARLTFGRLDLDRHRVARRQDSSHVEFRTAAVTDNLTELRLVQRDGAGAIRSFDHEPNSFTSAEIGRQAES